MPSRDNELLIDLVRGITALLVLVAHVLGLLADPLLGADRALWPAGWQLLIATLGNGRFWVRIFFFISGFCIHQSISRSLERGGFDLRHYAIARITRIYPLFLIGLALAVTAWWVGGSVVFPVKEMLASLFMAQHFTGSFPSFAPSWSLTDEAVYYAAWPLAILCCKGRPRMALHRSTVLTLLVTLVTVAIWKIWFGGDQSHWLITVWVISGLFVVWLAGAGLAIYWQPVQTWVTRRKWFIGIAWVLAVYLVEGALTYYQARSWTFMLADYLAIPGFAILVAGGHYCRLSAFPGWTAVARWMGVFSYPCYLLHLPVFELLQGLMKPFAQPAHPLLPLLLVLAVTLLFIATAGIALERYFMRCRARLMKSFVRIPEGGSAVVAAS
ncbi:MAG: putative acyltransferase [Verrucomicrobiaceae bacterium]|nr:putative acyltransferase [Verrucomicrobiaceae bacterium]